MKIRELRYARYLNSRDAIGLKAELASTGFVCNYHSLLPMTLSKLVSVLFTRYPIIARAWQRYFVHK